MQADKKWCPLFGELPQAKWDYKYSTCAENIIKNMRLIWGVKEKTTESTIKQDDLEQARKLYLNAYMWLVGLDQHKSGAIALDAIASKLHRLGRDPNKQDWLSPEDEILEKKAVAILSIYAAKHALDNTSLSWLDKAKSLTGEALEQPEKIQLKREKRLAKFLVDNAVPTAEWICIPSKYHLTKKKIYHELKKHPEFKDTKNPAQPITESSFDAFWKTQKICAFPDKSKKE